ncbi:uncharacterized protein BEWA_030180 [Theileria equi strain WA]|uniref:Membrane protein, putative n=1 Tax=Theileria equi strain WA TaxID=1537102 RepID=L0AX77_THEEQ|nr:uncharacterized protein BEWA_030180 [Theileria equi strain WA]AFZ80165.1 membrane protein, putative [Theileria equi strain WA]|eukprot:XP_004829831.1 uncharacterized protein BEWA_030180 [Theileria equi strain WA]
MGLLSDLFSKFDDSVIDFYGQWHVTIVMTLIIAVFTTVGFVFGYFKESFGLTVKFILAGAAVSALVCLILG